MDDEKYLFPGGRTAMREEGWHWFLRDKNGRQLDHDQYRHDLFQRNGIDIFDLRKFEVSSKP